MTVAGDPLELSATRGRIHAAARAANLSDAARTRALHLATSTPGPRAWQEFLSRALAFLGAGLVLAGIVCFVAFNWGEIGRVGKFALLELAIVGATLIAWRKLPKISGQVALFAAAALVGPLFALYGQTYQTGADPYGLFLTWFALIIPWTIAARFGALWLLALVLLDVSLILYWFQVSGIRSVHDFLYLPLVIALLHAAALAGWEWQLRRPIPWIRELWVARVIALTGFVALGIPAAVFVFPGPDAGLPGALGVAGLATAILVTQCYYRTTRRDLFMITAAVIAGLAWVNVFVARLLFETFNLETLGFLVMTAILIAEITIGLQWFRGSRRSAQEAG